MGFSGWKNTVVPEDILHTARRIVSVYRPGTQDINTITDDLFLVQWNQSLNCPCKSNFVYIMQLFYSGNGVLNNRTQIAFPYGNFSGSVMAIRLYQDGTWTNWLGISGT